MAVMMMMMMMMMITQCYSPQNVRDKVKAMILRQMISILGCSILSFL